MQLVTKIEFSRLCKVSKAAVGQAAKAEKLDLVGEGPKARVDLTGLKTMAYMNAQLEKQGIRSTVPNIPAKTGQKAPDSTPDAAAVAEAEKNDTERTEQAITALEGGNELSVDINALSKISVDKVRQIENIRKVQVETAAKRGELIDRDIVKSFMAKMYSIDVNEFRTLGANLAPEIAAALGIDDPKLVIKAGEIIESEVFKVLEHIKREVNDFLQTFGEDRVE